MPVGSLPSSTTGVTVGVASAYSVVLQSPAAAPQLEAKVQGGEYDPGPGELCHLQRPHSMPVGSLPSSTTGVTVGVASAYSVVLQSPAAAPQLEAKVHGGVLVF